MTTVNVDATECVLRTWGTLGSWWWKPDFFDAGFLDLYGITQEAGGARFTLNVPQGATITEAYITMKCRENQSGAPVLTKLSCEDIGTSPAFTTKEDFDARVRTSEKYDWDFSTAWVDNSTYSSPDGSLIASIQEVVDRGDWSADNVICVFWEDDGSASGKSRPSDNDASHPKLHVEYTLGLAVSTEAASDILKTSATLNGEIIDLGGGGNADERGFVYATTSYGNPGDTAPAASEYNDNGGYVVSETDSFETETFDLPLTGLAELTKHYVRAYAHNTLGYAYGDEVYFHTLEWLSGWPYREIVPIASATGAGTNYSVPVEVYKGEGTNKAGVAYLNNHCTDYPNDLRLTDSDGETKLDHWKTPYEDISAYTIKSIDSYIVDTDGNLWAIAASKIWKSTDGGDSWQDMFTVGYAYNTLFVDSNGNFYVAGNGASGRGIYRSTNLGENWTRVQALNANCTGFNQYSFTEITTSGAYQGYLLFGVYSTGAVEETEARIYRSTNSGVDWSQVWPAGAPGEGQRHIHICQADPYHHGYVYATVGDTVESLKFMRSTDGGTNWTDIWTGTENGVRVHFTAIAFTENYRLLGEDYHNGWVCRTSDDSTLIKLWQPSSPGTGFVSFMMVVGDVLYVGHRGEGPYLGGALSTARIDRALGPGFEHPEYIQFCGDDNDNAISLETNIHNPLPIKLGYLITSSNSEGRLKLIPGYRFWVKVTDDLSSDGAICIYYGKTGASSESDIKSAFILADDFDDNSLDTALWNSSGTISEETARLKASADEGSTSYIISKNKVSGNCCATVKFSEFTCPSTNSGYATLQATVGGGDYANAWRNQSAAGGRMWGLIYKGDVLQDDGFEAVAPLAGELKIVRIDGDDVRVYTRHESLGWDLRATADAMWSGDLTIQLSAASAENNPAVSVYFDSVIVRKYVSPEPVVGTPEAEETSGLFVSTGQGELSIAASLSRTLTLLRMVGQANLLTSTTLATILTKIQSVGNGIASSVSSLLKKTSTAVGEGTASAAGALTGIWTKALSVGGGAVATTTSLVRKTIIFPSGALSAASTLAKKVSLVSMGGGSISIAGALSTARHYLQSVGGASMTITSVAAGLIVAYGQIVGAGAIAVAGALTATPTFVIAVGQGVVAIAGGAWTGIQQLVGGGVLAIQGAITQKKIYKYPGQASVAVAGALGAVRLKLISVGSGTVGIAGHAAKRFVLTMGSGAVSSASTLVKVIKISVGSADILLVGKLVKKIPMYVGQAVVAIAGRMFPWIAGPPVDVSLSFDTYVDTALGFESGLDIKLDFQGGG